LLLQQSLSANSVLALPLEAAPISRIERFQKLYEPFLGKGNDLITKIIDNRGNGYESLYGLRNLRVVLHGVMYRGGANNFYHRQSPRDNQNPLPPDGLENLCQESFGEAIYLYEKNYHPEVFNCTSRNNSPNTLKYTQISVLNSAIPLADNQGVQLIPARQELKEILTKVHECATGTGSCPIYTHCWNGWHASGFISAVALRQFCNFTGEEAEKYWIDGTDSVGNSNYPAIKSAIRAFVALPDLEIPASTKAKICPQNIYHAQ
jgi:hypothetical protein